MLKTKNKDTLSIMSFVGVLILVLMVLIYGCIIDRFYVFALAIIAFKFLVRKPIK